MASKRKFPLAFPVHFGGGRSPVFCPDALSPGRYYYEDQVMGYGVE